MVPFDESVLCYVNCQIIDLYSKLVENICDWNKGEEVRPAFEAAGNGHNLSLVHIHARPTPLPVSMALALV